LSDFPSDKGTEKINLQRKRLVLPFNSASLSDCRLEDALKKSSFESYIKNLTGLKDPEFLVDLGEFFGKSAYVWTWWRNTDRVCSTWFDCYSYNFILNGINNLSNDNAFRGVRLGAAIDAQKI
jgi:hypothetical protein